MSTPRRSTPRRLGDSMRRKLEVTSAMAWEALVECHVDQAASFVTLLSEHMPLEHALPRYLAEMDLGETMATAIRTRVLMRFEETAVADDVDATAGLRFPDGAAADDEDRDPEGWGLLRQPRRVMRGVRRRQRRNEEIDRTVELALARAEEKVIRTHVENAISFVALLEDQLPIGRAVEEYLDAVGVTGGRAQAVLQRTMARLADVHLPA
jgi:hypothetical protein